MDGGRRRGRGSTRSARQSSQLQHTLTTARTGDAPKLPSSFRTPWTTFLRRKVAISNAPLMCSSTTSGVKSLLGARSGGGRMVSRWNGDTEAEEEGMKRWKRIRVCWCAAERGNTRLGELDRGRWKVF